MYKNYFNSETHTQLVSSQSNVIGLLLMVLFFTFSSNLSAQCSITSTTNASALTCGTAPLSSCGGILYIGDGTNAMSLNMDGNLNLSCTGLGAIQLIVRNNATLNFAASNNPNLTLASGSSIKFESGSSLVKGSPCSASKTITIGTSVISSCNGGGSGAIDFDTFFSQGGTCTTYSLTSIAAVATSCTTAKTSNVTLTSTAAGLPVGSYTVTYSLSYNGNSTSYTAPMTVTTAGSGQFTASLSIMGANNSTTIRVDNIARGSCNNAISSNNVSNTINQYQPIKPNITTIYASYPVCSTSRVQWNNDTFVSGYFLDVSASNSFGSYVPGYQDLNVGNVNQYDVTGLTPGTTYYYRIRNNNLGCGVSVNSNTYSFTTTGIATPGTISGNASQCASVPNQTYSITAVSGALSYTWSVPSGWTITSGTNSNSITVTTGSAGGNITVVANGSSGCNSGTSTLAVTIGGSVSSASSTPVVCVNNAIPTITHATTGFTAITNSGVSGANGLPAGVSATFASNTITITGTPTTSVGSPFTYNIPLTSSSCGTGNATGTITVNAAPSAPSATAATSISCAGFTANWGAVAGATKYYLEVSPDSGFSNYNIGGFSNQDAGNMTSYNVTGLQSGQTYYYRVRAFNSCGTSVNSTRITVTVNASPTGLSYTTASPVYCLGTAITTNSATLTGTGTFSVSPALPAGLSLNSSTGAITGTPTTATAVANYIVTATNSCGSVQTTLNITVNAKPVIADKVVAAICSGGSFTLQPINGTDVVPASTTYSWSAPVVTGISGLSSGSGASNISGTLTNTTTAAINVVYTVTPTGPAASSCSGSSFTVTVTVNAPVTAGVIGTNQTICSGTAPITLTSTTAGTGSGTITYEWQTNASGSYVTIGGATLATYSPPVLNAATSYQRRTVSVNAGTTCYSAYTTPVVITVNSSTIVPSTAVEGVYTFRIDNPNTYTTAKADGGQYASVNVVQGFTYTFSVGDTFSGLSEVLTILDASNSNVTPAASASGATGASITNWVSSLSGTIKVVLSSGNCAPNGTLGTLGIKLDLVGINDTKDNQLAYGADSWIGHVYNYPGGASPATGAYNAAMFSPSGLTGYAGYYTEAKNFGLQQFGGGNQFSFPLLSNGVNYTNIDTQSFAVRYRMNSTLAAGCYLVSIKGDDGTRLYIDSTTPVANLNNWSDHGTQTNASVLVSFPTSSTNLVFDYYENGGLSEVYFNIIAYNQASNKITPAKTSVCSGTTTVITGTYDYDGNSGNTNSNPSFTFSWKSNTDGAGWVTIPGVTSLDYTPPALTTTTNNIVTQYTRTSIPVSGSCASYESDPITITTTPVPATPGVISGTASQCPSLTSQNYSIVAVANATSYAWTVPAGWSITAGATTRSITVTTGTAGQNGDITVTAKNTCATSSPQNLAVTVNDKPTIATISSPAALCSGGSLNPTAPTVTANGTVVSSQGWELETGVATGLYASITVPYTVA
jgi:hypothetical protein